MTLGELIFALEAVDSKVIIRNGFANPHSYRGYYHVLSFEIVGPRRVGDILEDARGCIGRTFQGWKGGDYTMDRYSDVYLANEGDVGEELGPMLLNYMLADRVEEE